MREGTYYLGRVIKLGALKNKDIINSLVRPATIERKNNFWTILNSDNASIDNDNFVFGNLAKIKIDAEFTKVDITNKQSILQHEENILIAKSPFIYFPKYSGIAFLSVSNNIEKHIFKKRLCELITEKYDNVFVECEIDFIADLRTFAIKLSKLDGITKIRARVHPPNPLFSPLWGSLKTYLKERNANKLNLNEECKKEEFLKTKLPEYVTQVSKQKVTVEKKLPLTDAAILMAADGYGTGYIDGKIENQQITIRTSETVRNFKFSRDPEPIKLFKKVRDILDKINKDRSLEH